MMSREHNMICPSCESGELHPRGPSLARCDGCSRALSGDALKTIRQIVALPDSIGTHACECGHPEMRLLPDGLFWCPACGSEVLPSEKDAQGRLDYHGG
jgi:ribosomal protein L37AE/L43A